MLPPDFTLGLVSVTFRGLSPVEVVDLVNRAGLRAIEWGGDIHVPHGDTARACEVGAMTRDAGLDVASYGSYYCVGRDGLPAFRSVLDTAVALGAPLIRVWAGDSGSAQTGPPQFAAIAEELRGICDLAAAHGVAIATEFHDGTYCDTAETALALLDAARSDNLKALWQPSGAPTVPERLAEIDLLSPWLANVHAFQWNGHDPQPLAEGVAEWSAYLARLAALSRPVGILIEFVKDGTPDQFLEDAVTLRQWTRSVTHLAADTAAPP